MINEKILIEAIIKKFEERNSLVHLERIKENYVEIAKSTDLKQSWINYKKRYEYAQGIEYNDVLTEILKIVELLN